MTVTVTHTFVSGIADDPTAAAKGEVLPSHWNAAHTVTGVSGRAAITVSTDYYVSATGNDSNVGSIGSPWLTLTHAFDFIANEIDVVPVGGGLTITLHISGTIQGVSYTNSFNNLNGNTLAITGGTVLDGIQLNGDTNASIFVTGVTFQGTTNTVSQGPSLFIANGPSVFVGGGCTFNLFHDAFNNINCVQATLEGAFIQFENCTITGRGKSLVYIADGAGVFATIQNITFTGVTFDGATLLCGDDGHITDFSGHTGTPTGKRFEMAGRLHLTGYSGDSIQQSPGSLNGTLSQLGAIQSGDGFWHLGFVAGILNDTSINILSLNAGVPPANLIGFASDINQVFMSNTAGQWFLLDSYLTLQSLNHDLGAIEFSNRVGYGRDYVTDKLLSNCAIGFGSVSNPVDGQLRHFFNTFFNTEVLQIYQNGEWESLPANIVLRDNQAAQRHSLEHFPLTDTWVRVFSGDSELLGLNGLPIIQGYQVDLGANPAQQQLNGGTF